MTSWRFLVVCLILWTVSTYLIYPYIKHVIATKPVIKTDECDNRYKVYSINGTLLFIGDQVGVCTTADDCVVFDKVTKFRYGHSTPAGKVKVLMRNIIMVKMMDPIVGCEMRKFDE